MRSSSIKVSLWSFTSAFRASAVDSPAMKIFVTLWPPLRAVQDAQHLHVVTSRTRLSNGGDLCRLSRCQYRASGA